MGLRAPAPPALPRLMGTSPEDIMTWADNFGRAVAAELQRLSTAAGGGTWSVKNLAAVRTLDPTTATLPQVAQVLGTLITDQQTKGTIA
jgi:hypothetical protein